VYPREQSGNAAKSQKHRAVKPFGQTIWVHALAFNFETIWVHALAFKETIWAHALAFDFNFDKEQCIADV
jgi:hypothetical protein